MRSRAMVSMSVLALSLVSGGWLLERGMHGQESVLDRARLFDDVFEHVTHFYVDSIHEADLYRKAVDGLLRELHDPYSVYLTGDRLRRLTESTTGQYAGVGVSIDIRDGWITVVSSIPDTPAERAGLESGDRIVAIDSVSTHGWDADEASRALRGNPGSRVTLTVERPGIAEPFPVVLTRREIHVPSVRYSVLLEPGTGYIDLTVFSESSADEVERAVDSLRRLGMRELVFDLRGNPGGLLDQGVAVADLFLNPGDRIVTMHGRTPDANRAFVDGEPQRWPALPLVVLVDEHSASAAEIVAGALQDHDRALIVGRTSYGKGSAQSLFPLSNGGALKLTTALWFTPVGRSIDKRRSSAAPDGEDGEDEEATPVAEAPRTPYRTLGGRIIYGGGGIHPDVDVRTAAPVAADLALAQALGKMVPSFRDALADYARRLKGAGTITSEDFAVTPQMLDDFYRTLGPRGITLDRVVYDQARGVVSRELETEIARYVFGTDAEFLRRARYDDDVQSAVRLVKGVENQAALFERGMGYETASLEGAGAAP